METNQYGQPTTPYTITRKCGCTGTYHLAGKRDTTVDRKIQWLQSTPCTKCEREAKTAKAEEKVKDLNLPSLAGSEAQIKWAQGIRAEKVAQLQIVISLLDFSSLQETLLHRLLDRVDAKYWIDARSATTQDLIKKEFESQLYDQFRKLGI